MSLVNTKSPANTRFSVVGYDQKPFVSFPLLTRDGHDEVLTPDAATSGLADCVCLAWVGPISLAVYLMPPREKRSEIAFFVFSGSRSKVTAITSHKHTEFLEDLGAAIVDAGGDLEEYEYDTILNGIAAELCRCIGFFDGFPEPVLGEAWLVDKLKPEPGCAFGYDAWVFASYVAITRMLFKHKFCAYGGIYRSDFDPEGIIAPVNFAVDCCGTQRYSLSEFDAGVSAALEDYRARRWDYKAQIKKSKRTRPKRSIRVRELLWNSYPHICGICGKQIDSFDEMHVDHVIPLSRGGKDILANLQLTHAKCNLEKGSAMPECDDEGEDVDDDS